MDSFSRLSPLQKMMDLRADLVELTNSLGKLKDVGSKCPSISLCYSILPGRSQENGAETIQPQCRMTNSLPPKVVRQFYSHPYTARRASDRDPDRHAGSPVVYLYSGYFPVHRPAR